MSEDRREDVILSVVPAAPQRPLVLLSCWQDPAGWWQGWAEPVLFVGLVERRWYSRAVDELPADPRARRRFLRTRERSLEPIAYDVNATSGLSVRGEFSDETEASPAVLPTDAGWEEVIGALKFAVWWAVARPEMEKRRAAQAPGALVAP
jgi:hypothetical protein